VLPVNWGEKDNEMINVDTDTRLLLAREHQEQLRRAFEPDARGPTAAEPAPEKHRVPLLGRRRRRARVAAQAS
jgi:hypothetical protein